jgi:hypothetical protein
MLLCMWKWLTAIDLLAPANAVRNARWSIEAERKAMAEVDSVVARLHRHDAARVPAA